MANYEGDSEDDNDNVNNKANYSENNNQNSMQYIMVAHLYNRFFMHFLIAQNILLLNKASITQYFILNHYTKMGIMPDIDVTKVSIASKRQFKALQRDIPFIKLDTTCENETIIYFENVISLSSIDTV